MISQALHEQQRVQRHIANAEQIAHARATEPLTPLQQLVRSLLLEALSEYREAGIFPQNPHLGTQLPFFIDAHGTRCAMAHLLELGGEHELVARIANERNNAWVRELADEPRLLAWLSAAGLTIEEAAAIQPSYCSPGYDCVCNPEEGLVQLAPVRTAFLARTTSRLSAGMPVVQAEVVDLLGIDGATLGEPVQLIGSRLANLPIGTTVLAIVPINSLNGLPGVSVGYPLNANGQWQCFSNSTRSAPPAPIDPRLAARALISNDCRATLVAADPNWAVRPCSAEDGGTQFDASSIATLDASTTADTGSQLTPTTDPPGAVMRCSALPPGSTDPTSLGILLSIASALLARRRQHRARIRPLHNAQNAQK